MNYRVYLIFKGGTSRMRWAKTLKMAQLLCHKEIEKREIIFYLIADKDGIIETSSSKDDVN